MMSSFHEDVSRLRAHQAAATEYAKRVLPELVERDRESPGRYANLIECCRTLINDGSSMTEDARWLEEHVRRYTSNIRLSGLDPMSSTRAERLRGTRSTE